MRHEEQDVDKEGQQSYQKSGQEQNQEGKQVARRMRGRVEVGGGGEAETDESEERCDRVDDQDGRKRFSSAGGEVEVTAGAIYVIYKGG